MRTRLSFVKAYKDRTGKMRYYYRRKGQPNVPLPGKPGSPEFMTAYHQALGRSDPLGDKRSIEGSLSAVIAAYYQDGSFRDKFAPSTQGMRRRILEKLRSKVGHEPIAKLTKGHIVSLFLNQLPPFERNNYLKTLRGLMKFAVAEEHIGTDPTAGIKKSDVEAGSIHTWDEEEIAAYRARHGKGSTARRAMELLLNLAQRRSDVHKMGWSMVRDDVIHVRQQKAKMAKHDRALEIPILPELQQELDLVPQGQMLFLLRQDGLPFSEKGFGIRMREWCDQAGLPQCSAHGLRKAGLVALAEAGATEEELKAVSGHRNSADLKPYLEKASQRLLAKSAMAKLANKRGTKDPKIIRIDDAPSEPSANKVSNRFV